MAAYGFDEGSGTTVTDASGNGNNGTITNATWAASGKYGKALQFNGTNALVTIPDAASLHLSSGMTLEAWVNPSTVNANWRDVIYKGNDNFYLEATSSNSSRPDAGLIAGGSYADAFGTAALPANTWSYLTETYDGSTLRLYVNGTQVASTAHTGSIATSTNPLQIGGDSLYGQYFAGLIDEVRVYNVALTATQIQTDETTPVNPSGPPSQPGTLTATAVSSGEVDLSWGASSGSVSGYLVERCQGAGCSNFTQIAAPAGTGTSYKDTSVSANNSYSYRVRATDAAGDLSPYSNTASATTTPPSQPGTLTASAVSSGEVDLSWGASSGSVSGYLVERCQGAGCSNFTQIAAPAGTGTSYKDTSVSANNSYSYRVRATDAGGDLSPYSNTASATTPAGPSGLVAAYGFDEGSGTTVTDASGNGNNGTIANATWAASGKYGKALQFNGTNALVTIPDAASLHLSSGMTLEAWVNPSTVNANWRDVIYKGNDNFYLEATSSNSSRPDAGLIAGGSYADAFGTAALPANTWSYLTETYDGSTLRLYVNGTQVASTAHTGSIATSTNPLQIGGDSLYGQYFAGLIDEVRVYNVALTATQIQTDETTPVNPSGPPSQPGTLTATAVSSGEVDLSWGASSGSVSGYLVERCQGAGCTNFTQIAAPAGTGTSYKDTSVSANNSYSYRVRATDAAGDLSPYSNTASATTTPPSQPGTLTATAVSSGEVDLSWGASSGSVSGYLVERCQGAGCSNFTQIAAPAGTGTSYKDTSVSANNSYSYRVRATDAGGDLSPYSNTASATTPAGPSGLVAAYGFDEGSGTTVTDASGNGNNGTITNATWAASGKYGKALQFNGTNALVTIPDAASLHLSSGMTLEAWVNPSTVNANWRDVIYKGNDNFYLEATSSNSSRPDAGLIAGGSYADAFGTAALPANTWSYLTETYDGSTLRLYVNGTQVASTAHTGSIATSTNPLQIGGDSLYGQYFAGLIDEVRVYNVALTATQIQTDEGNSDRRPDGSRNIDRHRGLNGRGRPLLGRLHRQQAGVTGYQVERCQGSNCTNFTQIAAPRHRHQLQGHQRQRQQQLQLPRPRGGLGWQPRPILERRYGDDRLGDHTGYGGTHLHTNGAVRRSRPW